VGCTGGWSLLYVLAGTSTYGTAWTRNYGCPTHGRGFQRLPCRVLSTFGDRTPLWVLCWWACSAARVVFVGGHSVTTVCITTPLLYVRVLPATAGGYGEFHCHALNALSTYRLLDGFRLGLRCRTPPRLRCQHANALNRAAAPRLRRARRAACGYRLPAACWARATRGCQRSLTPARWRHSAAPPARWQADADTAQLPCLPLAGLALPCAARATARLPHCAATRGTAPPPVRGANLPAVPKFLLLDMPHRCACGACACLGCHGLRGLPFFSPWFLCLRHSYSGMVYTVLHRLRAAVRRCLLITWDFGRDSVNAGGWWTPERASR